MRINSVCGARAVESSEPSQSDVASGRAKRPHRAAHVVPQDARAHSLARPRRSTRGLAIMATTNSPQTDVDDELQDEPIPALQQLLDNPFLLLFLGIAMPTVLYIVWGVMEIVGIPIAK
jgi:hypothetical protein